MVVAGIISGGASILGGIFGNASANAAARRAAREKKRLAGEIKSLENSRQAVINPYANVESLSSMITNPFENLGVATQAAEMQAEQADIALANTLDTIAATGASAGGATALAQAALQSKKGISANIEQQEAKNEQLKAQGEQRQQQLQMSEEARVQRLQGEGEKFKFQSQENRDIAKLDRLSTQMSGAAGQEIQSRADARSSIMSAFGGVANAASGYMQYGTPSVAPSTTSMGSYDLSSFGTGINVPAYQLPKFE